MEPFTTDSVNYSGVQIKKNKSWTIHHTSHISLITIYYLSPVIYHHIWLAKTTCIFKTEENTQATTNHKDFFVIKSITYFFKYFWGEPWCLILKCIVYIEIFWLLVCWLVLIHIVTLHFAFCSINNLADLVFIYINIMKASTLSNKMLYLKMWKPSETTLVHLLTIP